MRSKFMKSCVVFAIGLMLAAGHGLPAAAQAAKGPSGLPLPRFVTLKSKRVNLRIGPSADYAVSWLYTKAGLPVEIIQEYDNWRRVRDADGTEGWVNQSLLSGQRAAVAAPWMRGKGKAVYVNMRRDPQPSSSVMAKLEPGVNMHDQRMQRANGAARSRTAPRAGWRSRKSGAPIPARPSSKAGLARRLRERLHRPRPDLLDDDAGGEAAELAAIFQRPTLRIAVEEAGGEEIAGTGRVDKFIDVRSHRHSAARRRAG